MAPEARKLLEDMRDAVADVVSFTAGRSIDDFRANKLLRRGVERSVGIVGGVLSDVHNRDQSLAGRISEPRKIIALRNILIHSYDAVDDETTWDVVQNDLPLLRRELDALLA